MPRMSASPPEPVKNWMRTVADPWMACERADWFIYVAHHQGCSLRSVVRALARNMPPLQSSADLHDLTEVLCALNAVFATGALPDAAMEEQLRVRVRPRLVDWNVALQYEYAAEVPDGIPPRATPAEEPVRQWGNAALRLRDALELDGTSIESWTVLTLVAQFIVFVRAGRCERALANRELCNALRTELTANGA